MSSSSPFKRQPRFLAISFSSSNASFSSSASYRFFSTPPYCSFSIPIRSAAISVTDTTLSFMEPISASFRPTSWFSNFGHKIPGVSRSSSDLFSLIHCFPFVTPGLFPVFVHAFPAKELIKVDFPTLGIPTTIARTGRFKMPRFLSRSIFSLHASCTIPCIAFMPAPL